MNTIFSCQGNMKTVSTKSLIEFNYCIRTVFHIPHLCSPEINANNSERSLSGGFFFQKHTTRNVERATYWGIREQKRSNEIRNSHGINQHSPANAKSHMVNAEANAGRSERNTMNHL